MGKDYQILLILEGIFPSAGWENSLKSIRFDNLSHFSVKKIRIVLFWKNVEKYGKTAVFPGGYGRIGDIPHGLIRV